MKGILAIGLGGGIGSIARYAIALFAEKVTPVNFPLGTLTANLLGCLLIGFFWSYFDRVHINHEFRLFLFTGLLGGFTTFSTFARETEQFFKAGRAIACHLLFVTQQHPGNSHGCSGLFTLPTHYSIVGVFT